MLISYFEEAGVEEPIIGDSAVFLKNDLLQYNELNLISESVVFELDAEQYEDLLYDEVSGEVFIEGDSVGQWSISYRFHDDFLRPVILEEIENKNTDLAKKVDCQYIKSLLVIEWRLSSENILKISSVFDYLLIKYDGVLFINGVGLFDSSGFLVGIKHDLYE